MGIEYIARALRIFSNHGITGADKRCVRILWEKRRHTSQRQPMRPLGGAAQAGSSHFLRSESWVIGCFYCPKAIFGIYLLEAIYCKYLL